MFVLTVDAARQSGACDAAKRKDETTMETRFPSYGAPLARPANGTTSPTSERRLECAEAAATALREALAGRRAAPLERKATKGGLGKTP